MATSSVALAPPCALWARRPRCPSLPRALASPKLWHSSPAQNGNKREIEIDKSIQSLMSTSNLYKTRSKRTGAWFLPGSPAALGLRGALRRGSSLRLPGAFFSPAGAEGSTTAAWGLSPAAAHASGTRAALVNLGPGELTACPQRGQALREPKWRRRAEKTHEPGALRTGARDGQTARRAGGRPEGGCRLPRTRRYGSRPLSSGPQAVVSSPAAGCGFPSVVRNKPAGSRAFPGFLRRGPCACFRFLLPFLYPVLS